MGKQSGELEKILNSVGVLLCNSHPRYPNIDDLGLGWGDVTDLMDSQKLFYCKAFMKRTTYLSPKVYCLLKACKTPKALPDPARLIYETLKQGMLETYQIKQLSFMSEKTYKNAFEFLLQHLLITVYRSGRAIGPNWSTYVYCTAPHWEKAANLPGISDDPKKELRLILSPLFTDREISKLME